MSKTRSQKPDKNEPPPSNSQHVKFSGSSPLTGTLIDLTKLDPKLAASFLEQLNISKISPKFSTAELTPEKLGKIDSKKLAFATARGPKEVDPGIENLYRTLGTTPVGQLVPSVEPLTPEQRQALEYMSKIRALTPDVKEVKRSSLPSSCKFLGDMDKFDDFKDAVEGHYRQQQEIGRAHV